ncbi:MAG: PAS domain S-box protein [Thermodesulfovibrionales bacterium]
MVEFFQGQMDYIFFFYGLAFVTLSIICFMLTRQKTGGLPWLWLGLFGLLHGLQEWAAIFSGHVYSNTALDAGRLIFALASFLCLCEFGRGGLPERIRGTGRLLFLPLLALALAGGMSGMVGIDVASRYALGLPGGILSSIVLFRAYRSDRGMPGRGWLAGGSISLALYAVTIVIGVQCAPFPPASFLNNTVFFEYFGFPVHLVKGILAVGVSLSLWAYARHQPVGSDDLPEAEADSRNIFMPLGIFMAISIAGWCLTQFAGNHARAVEFRDGNIHISALANHLTDELNRADRAAMTIAEAAPVLEVLVTPDPESAGRAALVLSRYNDDPDPEAFVIYLLDKAGRTVLSNTDPGERGFDPKAVPISFQHFRGALAGDFSSHYAVEPDSMKKKYMVLYPVKDDQGMVRGVVAVKKDMSDIETSFKKHAYCFLVDPHGVIFLSSRDDMHLRSLGSLSQEARQSLAASGHMGPGPFTPLLSQEAEDGRTVTFDRQKLLVTRRSLGHDNWSLVLLNSTSHISAYRLFSIFTTFVFFCMTAVFFAVLYFSKDSAVMIAASERRYRSLVEGSPNCVALFNADGTCLAVNRSGIVLTGLQEKDIVGRPLDAVWHGRTSGGLEAVLRPVLQGARYSYEPESTRPDGRKVLWSAVLNPLAHASGRVSHFVGIFMDITERTAAEEELKSYQGQLEDLVKERTRELSESNERLKREMVERRHAEEARRDSEERFHTLFNLASDCIFLLDPSHPDGPVIVDVNLAAVTMNGYEREEMIGRPISFLNHPEDMERLPRIMAGITTGEPVSFEIRHIRKDGTIVPLEVSARLISLGGRPYILGMDRDITTRKQAEEELQRHRENLEQLVEERTAELRTAVQLLTSEINFRKSAEETLKLSESKFRSLSQEFHTLLDAMSDELLLVAPDMTILWANKAFAARVGTDAAELSGRLCSEVWFDHTGKGNPGEALKSFSSGRPESIQISAADGRLLDVRAFPIKDDAGMVDSVILVASDITEKATLQAEAMRAGHLASLGELSAGVAHEINNPITGIINYAQIIANMNPEGTHEHDIAKRIVREGDRIAGIVRSLLSFARERKEDKSAVQFPKIIMDSITLTETQIRKDHIQLKLTMPEDLPLVVVNPQQVQQVVLNIISNARYALNRKYPEADAEKVLDISGSEVVIDGARYVRMVFTDYGTGIPADVMEKVLNPFFSTKPVGEGTGLGLSISHGIITDHGGKLRIESREGLFTSVIIDLPAKESHGTQA